MASFQVHCDPKEKENSGAALPAKEKILILGNKQPLAVIGGNERANWTNNLQRGIPIASGKAVLRDVTATTGAIKNAEAKKSNVVPVVEQFKAFSVYEDNSKNNENLLPSKTNGQIQQNNLCTYADETKDELHRKDFLTQHESDLSATPMSVTEALSPMSLDRSTIESDTNISIQLTDSATLEDKGPIINNKAKPQELPLPRNDRQRFFEVVQYQMDILENFRESEKKHRPKPQYMRRQEDINNSMRTILVDWLVEVTEEYNLDTETLYLSVSYIDRFLSQMSVVRSKLQLVGTAAMYIASKYEEIYPPDVGEFVFITDDSYTKGQVLRMEQIILKVLSFDLCGVTPYVFVNTYAVLNDIPEKVKYLTLYICELSLMEADPYLYYLPSLISAASIALARHILGMEIWTSELVEITTYKIEDLKTVVLQLSKTHKMAKDRGTQAIREKYNRDKYGKISSIEPIELKEEVLQEICKANTAALLKQEQQKMQPGSNPNSKVNLFYKY